MAAIIGNAALRAVDEGNGSFETHGREHRAKRLAGLGGVHGERFARKILLAVFGGLRPFANALDFSGIAGVLEQLLLVRQHLLVFRTAEQLEMVEHVVCILRHDGTLSKFLSRSLARQLSPVGESRLGPITPPPSVRASAQPSTAPWPSSRSAS